MSVCVECCMLSGRVPCDGLITRPEKSCQLWCVVVCDLETSRMRRLWPGLGCSATKKNVRHNHKVSCSGRLGHCPRLLRPLHPRHHI
jgi:hypothetical protein